MSATVTRAQFFRKGAQGGAALVLAGGSLAALAEPASADPLPNLDLAYARLLVGVELLSTTFYGQAIAASTTTHRITKYLKRAHLNEQEHYESVSGILIGSANAPAGPDDVNFTFPTGTFESERSILGFAQQLESLTLGAYLGAIGGIQTSNFKQGLAQIVACEAQHSAYFTGLRGGRFFGLSFPTPLTMSQTSNALDAFMA